MSGYCGREDGSLFPHCSPRWAGEHFPKQSQRQRQVFSPPVAAYNGDRPGPLTEAEGASSLAHSIMHLKDGFRVINGQWLELPVQPREALTVHKSPHETPTG